MAISNTIDVTVPFNANNGYTSDLSGWDYVVATFVAPTGTVSITSTNDGGAIQGVTDGNSLSALNFTAVQGTKLADGSAVTAVAAAGQYKVQNSGRYLKFGGASAAATKVILEYFKID